MDSELELVLVVVAGSEDMLCGQLDRGTALVSIRFAMSTSPGPVPIRGMSATLTPQSVA